MKRISKIKGTLFILSACSVLLIAGCGGGDSRDSAAIDAQLMQPGSSETKYSVDPAVIKADEDAWITKAASDSSDPMHKFALAAIDAGGLQALNRLMVAEDKTELRKVFGGRGIEIVDQREEPLGATTQPSTTPIPGPLDSSQCVKFYKPQESNRTYMFNTHSVYIDAQGRPSYASWIATPNAILTPTPSTPCQTQVGKWGIPDDDGGHLIARSLSGWGYRANIVPQNLNFNRGTWVKITSVPAFCQKLRLTQYNVRLYYADASVRPVYWQATTTVYFFGIYPQTASTVLIPNSPSSAQSKEVVDLFILAAKTACQAPI